MRLAGRWQSVAAAGIILALVLVFFWQLIFTNLILVGVDSFLYFYPYRTYVSGALLEGRFPLWNPHLFLGAPLFANMQTAVLYPLHWPLLWLPAPQQVAVSIVLHLILAGWGVLAYARSALRLSRPSAVLAAVVFALGGVLGAQAEHLNQLNCAAWLPWGLLLVHRMLDEGGASRRAGWLLYVLALAVLIALMILAGHAQSVFICLTGLGAYALLWPALNACGVQTRNGSGCPGRDGDFAARPSSGRHAGLRHYSVKGLIGLLAAFGLAVLLTAVQLLPALELSQLSIRSGGLSYREATSFSLNPWLLHYTLLPPYGVDLSQAFGEAYGEYVAYVGIIGLGLALLGAWQGWRRSAAADAEPAGLKPAARFFSLLAAAGFGLALGRINPVYYVLYYVVPGFASFRAPARWMLLYALAMALLAAIGLERLRHRSVYASASRRVGGWLVPAGLSALLCLELFVAAGSLRYRQPTAAEAFTFLRPSIAHLKTDPGLHRFLSLSGIVYDPGDLAEMHAIFADQLPERAIYDYVVAAKEKEVLFYNLPLQYGFYSVDGYDGGLLPLRDFVTMQRLFLADDHLAVDGRLREQLRDVPPGRLLSLLGVKYIITDKVYDVWIDGVFYDLQFDACLSPRKTGRITAGGLPDFPTTALGIVSHLNGAAAVAQDVPVAQVSVADDQGWSQTFDLRAGFDTSEGRYGPDVAHKQARIGHTWRDDPSGSDYVALIELDAPHRLTALTVESDLPVGAFVLRGLSLVDTRTTTSRQLTLSTEGHYRLVHSGDVKIYENLAVLPRALVVHRTEIVPDADLVIARLREPAFDPARTGLLAEGEALDGSGRGDAHITRYEPEWVTIDVATDAPGYLLLTDTYYPGWQATVDGQPAPILRANLMFRAVPVSAGHHTVEFHYRPVSFRTGLWVSLGAALLALTAALVVLWPHLTFIRRLRWPR
jgi:hypothetical protein